MKIYWYKGSKNIIGHRLKQARVYHKPPLSQVELSAKLALLDIEINRKSISKIESGDRFVADYEVVALANVLSIDIKWLLLGTNDSK